jgi:hypothetical protein
MAVKPSERYGTEQSAHRSSNFQNEEIEEASVM